MIHYISPNKNPLTLIIGLSETGVAVAIWKARHGSRLRIVDTRSSPKNIEKLLVYGFKNEIEYYLGEKSLSYKLLDGVSQLIVSPSFSPKKNPIKALLERAIAIGIEIITEIEIFSRAIHKLRLERDYSPKILAVTGTNGKTTVTSLTGRLIESLGFSVRVAGNIGPPALSVLIESLDSGKLPSVWVLELSSFQLSMPFSLRPDVSTILNLTEDHLDWHENIDSYISCKARLLYASKVIVLNRNNLLIRGMIRHISSLNNVKSFGLDCPKKPGDIGLETSKSGIPWLVSYEYSEKNNMLICEEQLIKKYLFPVNRIKIPGMHNILNVMASLQLVRTLGKICDPVIQAITQYTGEKHRLSFICTKAGVDYVNDSKSTNVGSTIAALESFKKKVILILGGVGKGQNFTPLIFRISTRARAVILIGRDALLISSVTKKSQIPHFNVSDLREAVEKAASLAKLGDVVLLSPACSSTDMFQDYSHRGEVFVENVIKLIKSKT